jgi:hypothetical protein
MVDSCNDWHFVIWTSCLLFIFSCYYQCAELCPIKVLNMASPFFLHFIVELCMLGMVAIFFL